VGWTVSRRARTALAAAQRPALRLRAPQPTERQVQRSIVGYLRRALSAETWFAHIANQQGTNSEAFSRSLLGDGLRPGAPDLLIVHAGRALFIECKSASGRLSEAQRACHAYLAGAGAAVAVVRSLEEAERALIGWGIPLKFRLAIGEPFRPMPATAPGEGAVPDG